MTARKKQSKAAEAKQDPSVKEENRPLDDSELEDVTGGAPTPEQYARYNSLPPSPTHSGNYRGWGGE